MSSAYWQTERQRELYGNGKNITERVSDYVKTWEGRCYYDGIPDEVPSKVAASNRAPSWKAIALCVLRNDHNLLGLGFQRSENETSKLLMKKQKKLDTLPLFDYLR